MESKRVTIELSVAEWNVVMTALSGRPFAEVVNLIAEIRKQAESQMSDKPEEVAP